MGGSLHCNYVGHSPPTGKGDALQHTKVALSFKRYFESNVLLYI